VSSLNHLELGLLDIRERANRERQFAADALVIQLQSLDALAELHHKALQMITEQRRGLEDAFTERDRMLVSILGTGQPTPETLDHKPAQKAPRIEKQAAES